MSKIKRIDKIPVGNIFTEEGSFLDTYIKTDMETDEGVPKVLCVQLETGCIKWMKLFNGPMCVDLGNQLQRV